MSYANRLSASKYATGAAALAILLAASPASAGTSRGYENGGYFTRFDPVVAEFNQSGKPFRIVGLCQSACTLFLSIRNVCIEPQATFQFHAGSDGKGNISTFANRHLLDHYNPKLRRFVIQNRYLETLEFNTISGTDMIEKFGYPACTAEHRLADADEREIQRSTGTRGNEGSYAEFSRRSDRPRLRGAEGNFVSR